MRLQNHYMAIDCSVLTKACYHSAVPHYACCMLGKITCMCDRDSQRAIPLQALGYASMYMCQPCREKLTGIYIYSINHVAIVFLPSGWYWQKGTHSSFDDSVTRNKHHMFCGTYLFTIDQSLL